MNNDSVTMAAQEACEALDALLIALCVTVPAPWPFAVEQLVMHARSVIGHQIAEQLTFT